MTALFIGQAVPKSWKRTKRYCHKSEDCPPEKRLSPQAENCRAKHVIHTVGPVWRGGSGDEAQLLASAYLESMRVAEIHKLKSLSFPSISTGAYGYPVEEAAKVAIQTMISFLKGEAVSTKEVVFVLFDKATYESYAMALVEATKPQSG